jgi:fatty-acyl-CoA synthase
VLGVQKGDRVLLYMQNSPQFVIAYYAILRIQAIVVPLNPMNVPEELAFFVEDSEASVAVVGQELVSNIVPFLQTTSLQHIIVATYSDYLPENTPYTLSEIITSQRQTISHEHITHWNEVICSTHKPSYLSFEPGTVAVLPYTSGTTGNPKGCIHTHETTLANVLGAAYWTHLTDDAVILATLPFFHVTGMQHGMNAPLYVGATIVIVTRWDRDIAAKLIETYKVTHWINISTMVVDFLQVSNLTSYDFSSLSIVGGGGAPLPKTIGETLLQVLGVSYIEGYGLSETMAQTHFNPVHRPKLQCMGVPSFGVDARVWNPNTQQLLGVGEEGEVIVAGPQVCKGYWKRQEATEEAFITLNGTTYFRTGDIAKVDEEGYYFIVDRLKRMINVSGFKVWPTEIEAILYKHPSILQACVIGVQDERSVEAVKAFVIRKPNETITEEEIIAWSRKVMANYKIPRTVAFVEELPLSGTGKILWRLLQEQEKKKKEELA